MGKSIGSLVFNFGANLSGVDRALNKAQKRIKKFGKSMQKMGSTMTRNVTLPLLGLGAAAVKFGSDLQETDSKFQQVFSSIRGEAEETAKTFQESFGLSELSAKDMLSGTGALLVGFGFTEEAALDLSEKVNALAVDVASFSNFSGGSKGASEALTKALLGETESAKSLDIVIRQGTKEYRERTKEIMKAEGVSVMQAKALNNLEIMYKQTTKAQGDYARTSGDFANQLRLLKETLIGVAAAFGEQLIPFAQAAVEKLQKLAEWFSGLSDSTKKTIVVVGLFVAAVGPFLFALGQMSFAVLGLSKAFGVLKLAIMKNPVGLIATVIATAAAAFITYKWAVSDASNANDQFNTIAETVREKIDRISIMADRAGKSQLDLGIAEMQKELKKLKSDLSFFQSPPVGVFGFDTDEGRDKIEKLKGQIKEVTDLIKKLKKAKKEAKVIVPTDLGGPGKTAFEEFGRPSIEALQDYFTQSKNLDKENLLSGAIDQKEFDKRMLQDKISHLEQVKSIYEQFGESTLKIDEQILDAKLGFFKEEIVLVEKLTDKQKLLNASMGVFGDIVTQSLTQALDSGENFFESFVDGVKRAVRALLIQLAVMTAIQMLMGNVAAGGLKAALTTNLGKIMGVSEFAAGGLVTSPQLALIGEGAGTSVSNPEVVAPLDKLKSMIGGGNQNIVVTGKIVGNDIWLSNAKTQFNRLRTT